MKNIKDIVNITKGKTQDNEPKHKKMNKKKIIIAISIAVILLIVGITMLVYN